MKAIRLAILGALAGVQSVDFMLAMCAIDEDASEDVQARQIVTTLRAIGDLANTNVRFLELTALPFLPSSAVTEFVDDVLNYALTFRNCTEDNYEYKAKLFGAFVDRAINDLGSALDKSHLASAS